MRVLLIAAMVCAAALGCAGKADERGADSPASSTASSASQSTKGPVITLTEASESWPAAIVQGRLLERHGCLLIGRSIAVFPLGTTWEPPLVVLDGGQSARVGGRVQMGGGTFEVGGLTQAGLPIVPAAKVQECARRTGATEYVWASPLTG